MKFFFLACFFLSFTLNNHVESTNSVNVETTKTYVWGPGLDPEKIVLRARYIFLQLVDKNGEKFVFLFNNNYCFYTEIADKI